MKNISLKRGDITTAKVKAIVNAANPPMLGGGGVDGAIHRAAGPGLLVACKAVKSIDGIRCPVGHARITIGANLLADYVIHTVGPRYYMDANPKRLLESAYVACLNLAREHDLHSIAFPAISCGAYRYPLEEAADIAISVCSREEYADMAITFYLYDDKALSAWKTRMDIT